MNRVSSILSMVLAAQLVLLAIVFWPGSNADDGESNNQLLNFNSEDITRIVVSDQESSLALSRVNEAWVLPEYHQLPADPGKITAALESLPALAQGWPVAQTPAAQQRFEVAEDNYQRKLQFASSTDTTSTVYLGTSPGFRKVHVRREGEDAIYAVEFNTFDLPVSESEWLDQTLLQLPDADAIQGLDYQLTRTGDEWRMAAGETPLQATVDSLVNGLQSLRVNGSADIATAAILRDMEVPPTLTVVSGEASYEYRLFEIEETYYVKRADIDIYFNVSALDYDRLNDVNAGTLLTQAEAEVTLDSATSGEPMNPEIPGTE